MEEKSHADLSDFEEKFSGGVEMRFSRNILESTDTKQDPEQNSGRQCTGVAGTEKRTVNGFKD